MKKITRNDLRRIIHESLTTDPDRGPMANDPMFDLIDKGADLAIAGAQAYNRHSHPYKEIYNRLVAESAKRGEYVGSALKPENIAEIKKEIIDTFRRIHGGYSNHVPPGALGLNELSREIVGSNNSLPDLFPPTSEDHDYAVDYFRNHEDQRNTSIVSWLDEQKAMIAQAYYSAIIRAATANGLEFVPATNRGSDFVQQQQAHRLAYGYLIAPKY